MHIHLALPPGDSKERLLVSLGDAVDDGLALVLQSDRIVVISIRVLGVDHHLPGAALLRGDLEGLLLRVRIVALVLVRRQDRLREPTHVLWVLRRPQAATAVAILHLLLRQNGLIVLLRPLVVCFLDDGVQGVQVWVARCHGLAGARRHDAGRHDALLLPKGVVLGGHVLLLADEAIQALNILGTELVVLNVAVGRLRVGRAARHVLQLNVVRVEILNDTNVVALLIRHLTVVLHYHAAIAVLLHIWRHLRAVKTARARLLISTNAIDILAGRAALAHGADLVLMLAAEGLELVVLGVVHAVVERFEAHSRARQLLLLLLILPLVALVARPAHLQWLAHVRRRRLKVVDLMLRWHRPIDRRPNGSELVVLRHPLPRLALHRKGRDAWQLPRVLDPVGVERWHIVRSRTERLMRIGRSHSRPLQPRRVVLLPDHLLILHIASFLHHVLLLNHVVLHVWVIHYVVIIRSIGEGTTNSGSLTHRLIHVVSRIGNASDHVRPRHLDILIGCGTAELVAAHVLVEYDVAVRLV